MIFLVVWTCQWGRGFVASHPLHHKQLLGECCIFVKNIKKVASVERLSVIISKCYWLFQSTLTNGKIWSKWWSLEFLCSLNITDSAVDSSLNWSSLDIHVVTIGKGSTAAAAVVDILQHGIEFFTKTKHAEYFNWDSKGNINELNHQEAKYHVLKLCTFHIVGQDNWKLENRCAFFVNHKHHRKNLFHNLPLLMLTREEVEKY